MYEKFEAELEELKKKEDTKARAESAAVLRQCRGFESNLLKVLELQLRRWALAVLRFVGLVAHQAVDRAVRGFG
jgi:hypothetical protein